MGWNRDEEQIWKLQYENLPIARMSENMFSIHKKTLLLKINMITGWNLPEHEALQNVLYDQFGKKLKEDYYSFNIEEIEYAFRSMGTTVEDWGKTINLNLIDKILIPYLHKRAAVREMESHALKQTPVKSIGFSDWKEACETNYQKFLNGKLEIMLLHWQCYAELVMCNFIASDTYEDFLNDAYKKVITEEKEKKAAAMMAGRGKISTEIEKTLVTLQGEGLENAKVVQMAKRLTVQFLFHRAKESAYKNLFTKS